MLHRIRKRGVKFYTDHQVVAMLLQAEAMGYSTDAGSPLDDMTITEIDHLVNYEKETERWND